jgi:SAM-dependent methyltransferase
MMWLYSARLASGRNTFRARLASALRAGTEEHYRDALLYDHEYRRRRDDVRFYQRLAPSSGEILELGCGSGRLLLPLCRAGHTVTGVDLSRTMLDRCRARLATAGAKVQARATLVRADFRKLALGRRFPLIVCPFNAFMHLYTRQDVEAFLASVRKHLAPGGTFAFDVMNPDLAWLSRNPTKRWARTRFRHPRTGERMIYETDLVYDAPLQIAFMRIYYSPEHGRGREQVVRLTHRYFYPLELEALLHYSGFQVRSHHGDFDGGALATDSEYQVLVCQARGKRI